MFRGGNGFGFFFNIVEEETGALSTEDERLWADDAKSILSSLFPIDCFELLLIKILFG